MANHQKGELNRPKEPATKVGADGTSKRNILRKGGGFTKARKERAGSKDMTEDDFDGPAFLDEKDPNYDPDDFYPPIFHMCDEAEFNKATEGGALYYPPTFESEKFAHATDEPSKLLEVANHFYKEAKGQWCCIKLDPLKLNCDVVYEAPAPVGDKAAYAHEGQELFPHIYGGIPSAAVIERFEMVRNGDGSFSEIKGI